MHYHQKMANTDMMTRLDSRTAFEECIRQVSILDGHCRGYQRSETSERCQHIPVRWCSRVTVSLDFLAFTTERGGALGLLPQ